MVFTRYVYTRPGQTYILLVPELPLTLRVEIDSEVLFVIHGGDTAMLVVNRRCFQTAR